MDRLIYLSMSGAKASLQRQDVLAHNLANASTNGFRAEMAAFRAVPVLGDGASTRAYALESTIGYDNATGPIQTTGRELDVAMKGNAWLAVQGADGRSMSRPTWALDEAVWVVVDGNNVVRVIQEAASGQPARIPVDLTAVTARFPGVIDELQLSRDGTRAAMVIDGQLTLASVEQTAGGEFALTYPRRLAYGLGPSVVSVSWRTGDDMVVTRNDPANPVAYVNLDGVNSDGPGRNLSPPVGIVAQAVAQAAGAPRQSEKRERRTRRHEIPALHKQSSPHIWSHAMASHSSLLPKMKSIMLIRHVNV